jgi:hypothetical protein
MENQNANTSEFQKSKMPAVFMFQPTRFEVLEPEGFKEWENLLRERVGLRFDPDVKLNAYGILTKSYCDAADDCDSI